MVNLMGTKYPQISIDNSYGQTILVDLYNVNGVVEYLLNFTPGALVGGTSPAYTYSKFNPIITKIEVIANNETVRSFDGQMLAEYMLKARNANMDGANFIVPMTDIQYATKKRIMNTLFPSFAFTQIKLKLTIAPLANITSGSPTGTSGSLIAIQEEFIDRSKINFKIFDFRMLQVSAPLSISGQNDLNSLLPTDSYYKSLLYFANTGNNYTTGSDSMITDLEILLNIKEILKDSYWTAMKNKNQSLFGTAMDTGFAMEVFMEDNDLTQLLALNNPIVQKSVVTRFNTTETGYLNVLKNIYLD